MYKQIFIYKALILQKKTQKNSQCNTNIILCFTKKRNYLKNGKKRILYFGLCVRHIFDYFKFLRFYNQESDTGRIIWTFLITKMICQLHFYFKKVTKL